MNKYKRAFENLKEEAARGEAAGLSARYIYEKCSNKAGGIILVAVYDGSIDRMNFRALQDSIDKFLDELRQKWAKEVGIYEDQQ